MNFELRNNEMTPPDMVLVLPLGRSGAATTAFSLTAEVSVAGTESKTDLIEKIFTAIRDGLALAGCQDEPLVLSGVQGESGTIHVCGAVARVVTRHRQAAGAIRAATEAVHLDHGLDMSSRVWVTRMVNYAEGMSAFKATVYSGEGAHIYCNKFALDLMDGLLDDLKVRTLN
ncbi:hypothetical protein [Arenimonas sp.]|uniref:hypothetical protein n=1 Tax=Arenimonas sp. TaxID=1872635 RepID=UPI0035AF9600